MGEDPDNRMCGWAAGMVVKRASEQRPTRFHRHLARRTVAVFIALTACLGTLPAASAANLFPAPGSLEYRDVDMHTQMLSNRTEDVTYYDHSGSNRGQFGAAWSNDGGTRGISFRLKERDGSWGRTRVFDRGLRTSEPAVEATSRGVHVVAWMSTYKGKVLIRVALRGWAGRWRGPTTIASRPESAIPQFLRVRADGHGNAVVYFSTLDPGWIVSKTLNGRGEWSAAQHVEVPEPEWGSTYSVVLTEGGRSIVASHSYDGIHVTSKSLHGDWSIAQRVVPSTYDIARFSLVQSGADTATLLWVERAPDTKKTMWVTDEVAGTWTESSVVPGSPFASEDYRLTGSAGHGVAFTSWDDSGIHWLPRAPDGTWGDAEQVTTVRPRGRFCVAQPQLMPDGRWVVLYREGDRAYIRFRSQEGSWGAPQQVSDRAPSSCQIRTGDGGEFALFWRICRDKTCRLQAETHP